MSATSKRIQSLLVRAIETMETVDEQEDGDIYEELAQAVTHITIALDYSRSEAPDARA